jgi:predicted Zn-dependent protease
MMKKILYFLFCINISFSSEFKKGHILIDSQTQNFLNRWVEKIYKVAKLSNPKVFVMIHPELNAFADSFGRIVIHSETIIQSESLEQLLGILCHEIGHIAGHHHVRLQNQMRSMAGPMAAATAIGALAAAISGKGEALLAGVAAGMTVSERNFLSYMQGEEKSADAAAISYCKKLGIPLNGVIDFFKKIQSKTFVSDPYLGTHPVVEDRIASFQQVPVIQNKIPDADLKEFQIIRAKMIGILKDKDISSLPKNMLPVKDFYHLYRLKKYTDILKKGQELSSSDPYIMEFLGDVSFKIGDIKKTLDYYDKARTKIKSVWLDLSYTHALTESNSLTNYKKGLNIVKVVVQKYPDLGLGWRIKARLHSLLNQQDELSLSMAEYGLSMSDIKLVETHAKRAQKSHNQRIRMRAEELLQDIKPK